MLNEIYEMIKSDPLDFAWHVCEAMMFAGCFWVACCGLVVMAGAK